MHSSIIEDEHTSDPIIIIIIIIIIVIIIIRVLFWQVTGDHLFVYLFFF